MQQKKRKKSTKAKVLAFVNYKGGVGKTTTAVQTAHCLADMGRRVLCIDMDPQFNLSLGTGVVQAPDIVPDLLISDVLEQECRMPDAIVSDRELLSFDVVPSFFPLTYTMRKLVSETRREYRLADTLAEVLDDYDCVLIDVCPVRSILTELVFVASDDIYIPTQMEAWSVTGLQYILMDIEESRKNLRSTFEVKGIIPTMLDRRYREHVDFLEDFQNEFGELLTTPIRTDSKLKNAAYERSSIFAFRGARSAEDYRKLSEDIIARSGI